MLCTKNDNWLSDFWSYLPFLCLNFISCLLCKSNTLWIILILLDRNVEQDVLSTRMTTLAFLFLELSPLLEFAFDFVSAL